MCWRQASRSVHTVISSHLLGRRSRHVDTTPFRSVISCGVGAAARPTRPLSSHGHVHCEQRARSHARRTAFHIRLACAGTTPASTCVDSCSSTNCWNCWSRGICDCATTYRSSCKPRTQADAQLSKRCNVNHAGEAPTRQAHAPRAAWPTTRAPTACRALGRAGHRSTWLSAALPSPGGRPACRQTRAETLGWCLYLRNGVRHEAPAYRVGRLDRVEQRVGLVNLDLGVARVRMLRLMHSERVPVRLPVRQFPAAALGSQKAALAACTTY